MEQEQPSIFPPINFKQWIDDHREYLKPPVCNKMVFKDQGFIVMVVGGPNQRKDFHYNEGPELFYQLEGDMCLQTMQNNKVVDIPIKAGEMFVLPAKVPHSPQRSANSVGLVVELHRDADKKDGLMWFCEQCQTKLYEEYFHLQNVEKDFPPIFDRFTQSKEHRTCQKCDAYLEL